MPLVGLSLLWLLGRLAFSFQQSLPFAALASVEAEVDSIGTDIVDAIDACCVLLDGALQDIEDLLETAQEVENTCLAEE